jgi:hypothetical protein
LGSGLFARNPVDATLGAALSHWIEGRKMKLTLIKRGLTACFVAAFCLLSPDSSAMANPLNSWKTSCRVDAGAVAKKGSVRTFRTSRNHCEGGIYKQRAEILSGQIAPTTKGTWLFETHVAMTTASNQPFTLFQIHDNRLGCAPPLSMEVTTDGRLRLKSDIKTGKGESCIRGALNDRVSKGRLLRDGTEQKLSVLVDFDGKGGFKVQVSIDGARQISGAYDPSKQPAEFLSKTFYFKHGVYSQNLFDYVMTSRDMKVTKVRLAN